MSKSQNWIFSRLQYFPYIAYVRKVKIKKLNICWRILFRSGEWRHFQIARSPHEIWNRSSEDHYWNRVESRWGVFPYFPIIIFRLLSLSRYFEIFPGTHFFITQNHSFMKCDNEECCFSKNKILNCCVRIFN